MVARSSPMAAESPSRRLPCAPGAGLAPPHRSPSLQCVLHQAAQHGQVDRLGDEVERAGLERAHRGIDWLPNAR
jgi:hypothetical protein